jgi:hypothetical protein
VTIGYLSSLIRTARYAPADPRGRRYPGRRDALIARPDRLDGEPDRLDGELDRLDGGRSREAVKFRHRELYT